MDEILEQMEYEQYLAEQELLDKIAIIEIQLSSPIITESSITSLNESITESVMNYIKKVISNTQNAWNKFKSSIMSKAADKFYENNKKLFVSGFIMNPPEGFEIPNLTELDKFIMNTTIPPYNSQMDSFLNSEKEFIKKYVRYFSTLPDDQKMIDFAKDKIFSKSKGNEKIGPNEIKLYSLFAANEYKKITDKISKDIKSVNDSTRNIENMLKKISENSTLISTMEEYFSEAENEEKSNSFKADASSNTENNSTNKENTGKEIRTKINIYFKASTQVLSTKMNLVNKAYIGCFKIMKNYTKLQKKIKEKDEKKEENKTETNNNDTTEVKI